MYVGKRCFFTNINMFTLIIFDDKVNKIFMAIYI